MHNVADGEFLNISINFSDLLKFQIVLQISPLIKNHQFFHPILLVISSWLQQ